MYDISLDAFEMKMNICEIRYPCACTGKIGKGHHNWNKFLYKNMFLQILSSHLNGSFFIKLNQTQCYLIRYPVPHLDRLMSDLIWVLPGMAPYDMTDWTNIRCQSCILYFVLLLLMVIWNRFTHMAMQSAKISKTGLQEDKTEQNLLHIIIPILDNL
jgi:hypothetical protein